MPRPPSVHWSRAARCWRSSAGGKDRYFRDLAPNESGRREALRKLAECLASDPAPSRRRVAKRPPPPVEVPLPAEEPPTVEALDDDDQVEEPTPINPAVAGWSLPAGWTLARGETVEGALSQWLALEANRPHGGHTHAPPR